MTEEKNPMRPVPASKPSDTELDALAKKHTTVHHQTTHGWGTVPVPKFDHRAFARALLGDHGVMARPQMPPRATDEQVREWAKRHDLPCWDHLTEARAAFEDAQTLHLADGCAGG